MDAVALGESAGEEGFQGFRGFQGGEGFGVLAFVCGGLAVLQQG